jgi:predicted secreted protein
MRHLAALAASALLGASMLTLAAPAFAGDAAHFGAIGFSADGRYFAFREFGVQDGSGFPYANVYILDVAADAWAGGSPFRERNEADGATLAGVIADADAAAADAIADLSVTDPALYLALNADGEMDRDPYVLPFGAPGYGLMPAELAGTLQLETFPSTSPEPCASYGAGEPMGFALSLDVLGGVTELHRDSSVPSSRGCTEEYHIYGILVPPDWHWNALTPVAIVSVYSFGFEGPDRRFIALPVTGLP